MFLEQFTTDANVIVSSRYWLYEIEHKTCYFEVGGAITLQSITATRKLGRRKLEVTENDGVCTLLNELDELARLFWQSKIFILCE